MDLIICWVAYPILMAVLCAGCGALVEIVAGRSLGLALRLPCGFALIVVVMDLATRRPDTASLAVPLVIGLAATGLVAWWPWPPARPDWWAVLAGVGVFAVFAAPIVVSGEATFAGYIKLDDTATWLAFVDRVLDHGRTVTGLAPSSYEATLAVNLPNAYPLGSFLPLGLGPVLVGQDMAWLVAPYMALLGGITALALYSIAGSLLAARWQRALAAFVAGQAALLYGYVLWGGVKEVVAAALAATFAAVAPRAFGIAAAPPPGSRDRSPTLSIARAAAPAALVAAATISALSAGGLVWVLPAAAVLAVPPALGLWRRWRRSRTLTRTPALTAVLGLGAIAALAVGFAALRDGFLSRNLGSITNNDLANLVHPLSWLQIFGIWPAGDFRLDPAHLTATHALIGVTAIAAVVGVAVAVREGGWSLVAYVAAAVAGATVVGLFASPWLTAKALTTASPALPLAAMAGAGVLWARGRRPEAALIALAITGGVIWSNVLAYRDVNLAPRAQLAELQRIGQRIAGQAPALMTEYNPYGVRHFLRGSDGEGASELRARVIPLRNGVPLSKGATADIDQFALAGLFEHRTLVLRRSPLASRPPLAYSLIFRGRYYDVWQRSPSPPAVLADLPLGDGSLPHAATSCRAVANLARTPRAVTLAAPVRGLPVLIALDAQTHPPSWIPDGAAAGALDLGGAGTMSVPATVQAPGRYAVWVGGSLPGKLTASIAGQLVGEARNQLQYSGGFIRLGYVNLSASGSFTVSLHYGGHDIHPGSGGIPASVGPLVLSAEPADPPLLRVPVAGYRQLCGRRLDWIEALGS
jgi:hypothetical protein